MVASVDATPKSPSVKLISGPEMQNLEFRKGENFIPPKDDSQVEIKLNLGLNRFSETVLGVELTMEIVEVPDLDVQVAFRAVFEIENPPEDSSMLDKHLLHLGGRVAPSLLYPFIREATISALQKALLAPIVPPIMNFDQVFDLKDLTVPPQPAVK